jgi:dihydroorotase
VPFTARVFGRAVIMPNLKPPVRTLADASAYRDRVLAAVPPGVAFEPLMTLYLTGAFADACRALVAARLRVCCER